MAEAHGPAPVPRLALTVQYATDRSGLPGRAQLRRWALAALLQDTEVTLRFVDEDEGRQLNHDFRGKDSPTNVLTFVYDTPPSPLALHSRAAGARPSPLTGDIVLCAPVVAREARAQDKPLDAHYAHMVVHGLLHLQGFEHETDTEAAAMEAVESFILRRLGYPDPYPRQ